MTTFEQQALAQQVLDHVEAHPENHDQGNWGKKNECGTTMCIAGTAALLSGSAHFEQIRHPYHNNAYLRINEDIAHNYRGDTFFELGKDLLGLEAEDAFQIFYCLENDKAKEALRYVANGKQVDWDKINEQFAGE